MVAVTHLVVDGGGFDSVSCTLLDEACAVETDGLGGMAPMSLRLSLLSICTETLTSELKSQCWALRSH